MEEGAPAEAEFRREAEVVKQVRESDMDLEPRIPPASLEATQATTAPSSPSLTQQDSLDDAGDDEMMGDINMGLSNSFKQHAMKNSKGKGKTFWDTFSESSSTGGARTTPPPAAFLPRGSSSGISEDLAMDSPSLVGQVRLLVHAFWNKLADHSSGLSKQRCSTAQCCRNHSTNK